MAKKKIFIAAHYNLNNGDRAVLEATKEILQNRGEEYVVSAYCPEKMDNSQCEVVSWPIKNTLFSKLILRMLKRINKVSWLKFVYKIMLDKDYYISLQKSDFVVVSGGHHLTDILGDDVFYDLAINFIIPMYCGKKVILLPQTMGSMKFDHKDKKNIMDYILKKAKLIGVRDASSVEFIENNFDVSNYHIVPDIVFGYNANKNVELIKDIKRIGIALYCNYADEKGKEKFQFVISELEKAINIFIQKDYIINIIPMEVKGTTADDRIYAEKIISSVLNENENATDKIRVMEVGQENIKDIINCFAENDVIIAYKTHSVVFSLISNTPVVAVAYHKKSIEFMEEINLSKYAIWDYQATMENICALVDEIICNEKKIREIESEGVRNNRVKINDFLDKAFSELL